MATPPDLSRPLPRPEGKVGGGTSKGKEVSLVGGTLVLTLDDVLSRVPTRSLKPGLHDPTRELHFEMEELLDGISRGRATIMLSKLAARYPDTFEGPAPGTEDTPIYLPLQKLIQQIGRASRRAPEKIVLPAAVDPTPVTRLEAAPTSEPAPPVKPLRRLQVMQEPVDLPPPLPAEPRKTPEPVPKAVRPRPVPDLPAEPKPVTVAATEPVIVESKTVPSAPPAPVEEPQFTPFEAKKVEAPPVEKTPVAVLPPLPATPPPPPEPEALQPPPLPVVEPPPPPEIPHSPILENAPPAAEPATRLPAGRPAVRPPSIQGPAGMVAPEVTTHTSPTMPGFVFAPRPSAAISEFSQTPFPPEAELPEVHIPPLFPVHPPPPAEAKSVPPEPPAAVDPEPIVEPEAVVESTPVVEPVADAEPAPVEAVTAEPPPPEPAPAAEREPVMPTAEPEAEEAKVEPEPLEPPDFAQADEERQIFHASLGDAPGRGHDLLGTHFSLARIDQEPLQAIFMTEEFLDLPRVSQLSCSFPGITGCMIVAGDALAHSGERPAGLDAQALCQLTKQLSAAALSLPEELPAVQTYTLHIGNRALSVFARTHVSLCLVHSHRGFLPGVRERLSAVADTLSRGLTGEPGEG